MALSARERKRGTCVLGEWGTVYMYLRFLLGQFCMEHVDLSNLLHSLWSDGERVLGFTQKCINGLEGGGREKNIEMYICREYMEI